ncbi:MAG: CHASE2 domain-containing protein [Candidatus Tectomicrobia bacterium]|nr:CHASE2 domain-containing protein [Candidatus Tectomicrobia bacterium]
MRPRRLIFISFLFALLFLGSSFAATYFLTFYPSIELKTIDARFRIRGRHPSDRRIVMAAIDEKSLESIGRWPWPRTRIAQLVTLLSEGGAKIIALDILFPEPSTPEEDQSLAEAVTKAGVITAIFFALEEKRERQSRPIATPREALEKTTEKLTRIFPSALYIDSGLSLMRKIPQAINVTPNIPIIAEASKRWGHVNLKPDVDGAIREASLLIGYHNTFFPSLSLKVAQEYEPRLSVDHFIQNIDHRGLAPINFSGPTGTYQLYSAADILDGTIKEVFREKIVLVGATAVGIYDHHVTPFDIALPGVELHANVLDNLLNQKFLWRYPWELPAKIVGLVLLGLLMGIYYAYFHPIASFILTLILGAGYLLLAHYLFAMNIVIDLLDPLLFLGLEHSLLMTLRAVPKRIEEIPL